MKSIGYKLLGLRGELPETGISLLSHMRSSMIMPPLDEKVREILWFYGNI